MRYWKRWGGTTATYITHGHVKCISFVAFTDTMSERKSMPYDKVGNGYLGKNQYKKHDNHPEYNGKLFINLGGGEIELLIGGWVKEKDGRKFFSLSVERKPEEGGAAAPPPADDEVPF